MFYMSKARSACASLPASTLPALLGNLDELARSSGLIRRASRKFSAEGFLLTLLNAVCRGQASFREMAMSLASRQSAGLARQSLHERFHPGATRFLQAVLGRVLHPRVRGCGKASPFARILVEDSTQLWMPKKNASIYRAVANTSGDTAGAKLDFVIDLMTGVLVDSVEVEAHVQDRSLGPRLLGLVRKRDLVLRDLGYFDVAAFAAIEAKGASWVSRLHGTAGVMLPDGTKLEALLRRTDQAEFDLSVTITGQHHPARLIAVRLPREIASRRRRQKKEKRKKNRTSPNRKTLVREGWNLYVTNLAADQHDSAEIVRLYRQRWQIEIRFRALKQSTQMRRALGRVSSEHHLRALLLAAMLFAALTARIQPRMKARLSSSCQLSMERLATWFGSVLTTLLRFAKPLLFDPRYVSHDLRPRKTLNNLMCNQLHLT